MRWYRLEAQILLAISYFENNFRILLMLGIDFMENKISSCIAKFFQFVVLLVTCFIVSGMVAAASKDELNPVSNKNLNHCNLYVSNRGNGSLLSFLQDKYSGRLRAISIIADKDSSYSVAVSKYNKFLFSSGNSYGVRSYKIGKDGGIYAKTDDHTLSDDQRTEGSILVNKFNNFIYVSDINESKISEYKVSSSGASVYSGVVRYSKSGVAASYNGDPQSWYPLSSPVIDPSGSDIYVASWSANNVVRFAIGADGRILPDKSQVLPAGKAPIDIAIGQNGKELYIANFGDNTVSQYVIEKGGVLAPLVPAAISAGTNPTALAIDPTGRYLYVANFGSDDISQYKIEDNGALIALKLKNIKAGNNPTDIVVTRNNFVYVSNFGDDDILEYRYKENGELYPIGSISVRPGVGPWRIAPSHGCFAGESAR